MFAARIHCPECGFKTPHFAEGFSVASDAFTVVAYSKENGFRLVEVPSQSTDPAWADLSDPEFDDALEASILGPQEVAVRTRAGQEEELPLLCPKCGCSPLSKKISGLD